MNRRTALALSLLIATLFAGSLVAADRAPHRRVVMISIDGLKPEYLLQADRYGLKIPNLRALMIGGAWADGMISVLPSATYPAHTTLITGVLPRVHGITSNYVFDPTGSSDEAWFWFADSVKVPTLVSAARAKGLTTAAVSWPVSIGLTADYNMPEYWRKRSSSPYDRGFMVYLSTPGLLDAVGRSRGLPLPQFGAMSDADRADVASWIIENHAPDLVLLHIFDTDWAQHKNGPFSAEALAAIENADTQVGKVLASLRKAGATDGTLILVVSDHGFVPASKNVKPNTWLREAGLVTCGANGIIKDWKAFFEADGGSAQLYLRDPADAKTFEGATAFIRKVARGKGSVIQSVLDAAEVRRLGGEGVLAIDAKEGFNFTSGCDSARAVESDRRGTHGHQPERHDVHAALVVSGAETTRGSLGIVRMTSVAPTIAKFLGLDLSPEAGPPLAIELDTTSGAAGH